MLAMLQLDRYSPEVLLLLFFFIGTGTYVVGTVTDMVMRERGYGPVGNGCLAVMGCFFGIYSRNAYFSHAFGNDLVITGVSSAASAIAILLIFGVLKHWVTD